MRTFLFILLLTITYCNAKAQLPPMPPRPAVISSFAPFYHGVASGDPLADRVIIWTRVTPTVFGPISVNWQMATDTLFTHVVNSGTVTTDSSVDYTVKVDVTGLNQNTWYYYRFKSGSSYSIAGRTRTLPTGNADSLRFAVFSCSDFQTGYFNAYHDIAHRNDIDAIMHLGDWYYEYLAGGSDAGTDTSRFHPLTRDAYLLADYRLWQSQYRLDHDLMEMMQQYPMISIWDDHESANNSWNSGAQNHNSSTQGNWFTRKHAAQHAYFEWMPIRAVATGNDSIIHRNFKWGNLMNLIMLDTRLEGRDSSLGSLIPTSNAYMNNTSRKMIGPVQLTWLENQLSDTSVKWRIIGNQVMIAPLTMNILVTNEVLNGDQWDGYPAERKRVYDYIAQNNIKDVVFLSGDIHSSWANDLPHPDSTYVSSTGAGSIATEFIGSSITSSANVPASSGAIMAADPWFKYIDFTKRGYLLFDVNKTRAQGDYIHVSGISSTTFTSSDDAQWVNLDNERHLRIGTTPLGPNTGNPPLVSFYPSYVQNINNAGMVVFSCYPNPATNEITLQYYLNQAGKLNIGITDINGKSVYNGSTNELAVGVNNATLNISDLSTGIYFLTIGNGNNVFTQKIVKR